MTPRYRTGIKSQHLLTLIWDQVFQNKSNLIFWLHKRSHKQRSPIIYFQSGSCDHMNRLSEMVAATSRRVRGIRTVGHHPPPWRRTPAEHGGNGALGPMSRGDSHSRDHHETVAAKVTEQQSKAAAIWAEIRDDQRVVDERTADLRAMRLARENAASKANPITSPRSPTSSSSKRGARRS